jgi:hypothetical protein
VTLDLQGSNWTQPLDGGGLDLSFNPAVLSLQSVTVNTDVFDLSLLSPLPAPAVDNSAGTATGIDFFTLLNASPTGNFDIASLTFVTRGIGAADLNLSEDAIGLTSTDANYNVTSLVAGTDFQFQTANVTVSNMVAPVPEPPTYWLLIVATLVGFSVRQWKLGRTG